MLWDPRSGCCSTGIYVFSGRFPVTGTGNIIICNNEEQNSTFTPETAAWYFQRSCSQVERNIHLITSARSCEISGQHGDRTVTPLHVTCQRSCPCSSQTMGFAWIQIHPTTAASPLFSLKSLSARGSFKSCLQVLVSMQRGFCLFLCSTPASLHVLNTLNKGDLELLAHMEYVTTAHPSNSFSIFENPFPLPLAIILC